MDVTDGGSDRWCRAGKAGGASATTGFAASDLLDVFSTTAAPFEPGVWSSKFAAHALLDRSSGPPAAARALARRGYGGPKFAVAAPLARSAAFTPTSLTRPPEEIDFGTR